MTIDPESWPALSKLLDEWLDLPAASRAAWLERHEPRYPALLPTLRKMVEAEARVAAQGLLNTLPSVGGLADAPAAATPVPAGFVAGEFVGPYRLVRELGLGGMGMVWLAERADGTLDRRVALKLPFLSLHNRALAARFTRERDILAQLTHPRIARLYDAGVADGGQPFLAMEYVEGESIASYCDRAHLGIKPRLKLFLLVLDAVQYSHTNLVVHRDLKPANILVTKDGDVRLLDFGIAKLLTEGEAQETELTRIGGRALTPDYASPEQVTGGAITTASDVYSLGVVLFELLTGERPYKLKSQTRRSLEETIVTGEPLRPSQAVRHPAKAHARGVSLKRLAKSLKGDLDTIVFKALSKDPARRYATADAFAEDLSRHLSAQPVLAQPDSTLYRTRKFLHRHWIPVSAAAAVLVSLSAGLLVANHARRIAEHRFDQLRQLSNRIYDLDRVMQDVPGTTRARQDLIAASLEYLEGLGAGLEGDPELAREVGQGYWRIAAIQGVQNSYSLGQLDKADASLRKADQMGAIFLKAHPADHEELLRSANISVTRAYLAQLQHRDSDALQLLTDGTKRLEGAVHLAPASGHEMETVSYLYAELGRIFFNLGKYRQAASMDQLAADWARKLPSQPGRLTAALSQLSNALRLQGDLEGSYAAIQKALKVEETVRYASEVQRERVAYGLLLREGVLLGEDHAINLGRPQEALVPLRKAFDLSEQAANRDRSDFTSRDHVALSGLALANILRHTEPANALEVYDRAIARIRESPRNILTLRREATLLANSSYPLRSLGREHEAGLRISRAFDLLREAKIYPAAGIELGGEASDALCALADQLAATGHAAQAAGTFDAALQKAAAQGIDSVRLSEAPALSRIYEGLARSYQGAGDNTRSREMAAQRIALWESWDKQFPGNSFVRSQMEESRKAAAAIPTNTR